MYERGLRSIECAIDEGNIEATLARAIAMDRNETMFGQMRAGWSGERLSPGKGTGMRKRMLASYRAAMQQSDEVVVYLWMV